jgi:hypothetical protein
MDMLLDNADIAYKACFDQPVSFHIMYVEQACKQANKERKRVLECESPGVVEATSYSLLH